MKNLKRSMYLLVMAVMLFSCGKKPNNPEEPQVGKDSINQASNPVNPDENFIAKPDNAYAYSFV